jgi:hypothetical protein
VYPLFLLASKCLVCWLPTPGINIHLRQTISTHNKAQNLHSEPIHPRKVYSNKYSIPIRAKRVWVIFLKKYDAKRKEETKTHASPKKLRSEEYK